MDQTRRREIRRREADLSIGRAVRDILSAAPEVHAALARRLGVGVTDLLALDHLSRTTDSEGVVSLGRQLGVTSASATVLVNRLVDAGHLQRSAHPSDGRRTVLILTDHARDEVAQALAPLITDLAQITARLDNEQARTIADFLSALDGVLERFARGNEEERPAPS